MAASDGERHPAARAVGWLLLAAAALLLIGGYLRDQANMISSGLLFAVFGLIATLDLRRASPRIRAAIVVLAVAAGVWCLITW